MADQRISHTINQRVAMPLAVQIMLIAISTSEMFFATAFNRTFASKSLSFSMWQMAFTMVFTRRNYSQIFNSVVGFNIVYVMDMFMALKLATEMLFHDKAMHKISFAVNCAQKIASRIGMVLTTLNCDLIRVAVLAKALVMFWAKTFSVSKRITQRTFIASCCHYATA